MPSRDREQNTHYLEYVLVAHLSHPLIAPPRISVAAQICNGTQFRQNTYDSQDASSKIFDLSAISLLVGWLGYYKICQNRTDEIN
jgi:hypothetical protein